jgi:hypothetical protein
LQTGVSSLITNLDVDECLLNQAKQLNCSSIVDHNHNHNPASHSPNILRIDSLKSELQHIINDEPELELQQTNRSRRRINRNTAVEQSIQSKSDFVYHLASDEAKVKQQMEKNNQNLKFNLNMNMKSRLSNISRSSFGDGDNMNSAEDDEEEEDVNMYNRNSKSCDNMEWSKRYVNMNNDGVIECYYSIMKKFEDNDELEDIQIDSNGKEKYKC